MSKWTLFSSTQKFIEVVNFELIYTVKYITVSIYLSRHYTSLVMSPFWKFVQRKKSPNQQKFLLEYHITLSPTGARLFLVLCCVLLCVVCWFCVVLFWLCSWPPRCCPAAFPTWSPTTLGLHPPQVLVLPLPVPLTPRSVTNPGMALGGDR